MKETNQENNFNILNTTMLLNCRLQDHSEFKSGIQNGRTDEEKLTKSRTIVQNFLNKLQRRSTYHESSASIPQGNKFHSNGDLNSDKNLLNNTKKSFEDNSYTPLRSEISSIENKKPERSGAGVGSGLCYNRRTRAYNRNYTINISDNLKANIGFSDNCTKIPVKEKNVNESVGFDFKILKEELCNNNENDFENEKSHKRSLRTEALGNKTKFVILNNMLNKQTDENVDAKNVEEKCGHVVVITEKTDKNASYDTNSSRVEDNLAFRASRIKRQNFRSYVRSHSNIEGLADGKISKNKLFDNNQDGVIDDNTDGFAEKSNKNGSREEDDADQFKSVILPKYYENLRNGSIDKNFSSNSVDINNNNNNLINASHDKVTSERVMSLPNTNAFDKNKIDYNCIVKPSKSFVHLQDTTRKANKSEELVHNGSQHKVTEQTEKLNNMNLYAESKVQTNYNGENYSLTSSSVSSSSSSSPPSLPTSSPPPLSPSPSLSDLQKSHFPSFISALPPTTPCNLHTPIMLQCILNNKDLSITWFKNSSKIHETNNLKLSFDNKVARLIIFDVTKDDLGCYKCEAGSNSGFVSTQTDLKPINNNQKDGEEKDKLLRSTDIQVRRKIREELAHLRKNVDNASGEKEKSLNLDESHISSKESRTNETNNVNSNKTTSQSNTSKSGDIKSEVPTEGGLNKVNEKASTKNSSSLHRVSANLINTVKKDDDLEHESAQVKEKLMNGSDGKLNESKPSRRELIRIRLEQARERMKQIDIEFKTEDCIPARNHRTELSSTLSLPASVAQASNPPKSFFSNHKSLSRQDDATKGSNTKITIDNNRSLNDKQAINQANITNSNINSSRINSFKQFDRNNNDCQENQWKVHYKNASYNQPSNSPPDQTLTPELLAKKLSDLMNGNEGIYGNVRVKTTEWNSHNNKKNHVAKTVSWTPACKDGDSVQKKEPSFRTPMPLQRSASTVKQKLLQWCNIILRNYPNMHVSNFSTSWNDGMAFCAIIHYFLPEKIDFDKLDHNNHKHNFQLAFETAESCAGVLSLLEVQDMVDTSCPDWKSVFMYVESLYRAFVINKAAEKFRKKNLLKES